jgi:hypothetical protein
VRGRHQDRLQPFRDKEDFFCHEPRQPRERLSPWAESRPGRGIAVRDAARLPEGVAFRVICAGPRSANEFAPRSPACSRVYGLNWMRDFRESSSRRGRQSRPQFEPSDRGRAVGCGPSWLGQAAHCEGRPWRRSRQGTAKPWIRRRGYGCANTYDPAPAFAGFAGFAADTSFGSA